jgi:hypothetical protein
VASQAHVANYQASSLAGLLSKREEGFSSTVVTAPESFEHTPPATWASTAEDPTPEVIAQGVEFVAYPGKAEKLQSAVPEAMRDALGNSRSFSGCLVLVSEQEARLVTVITLWTGRDRAEQCNENSKRVNKVLTPYVDRWLRTRRLAAFLSTPLGLSARR